MSGALKSRSTLAARVGGALAAPPSCAAATRDAAMPATNADAVPINSRRLIVISHPLAELVGISFAVVAEPNTVVVCALVSFVYIGTYTGDKSKGIYLFQLQAENRAVPQNIALAPLGLAAETPSPSFLEL